MHLEAKYFLDYVKRTFPEYFINKKVLDVGGGDINGNNKLYFFNCEYNSNDVVDAPNVTIVSKTKDLPFSNYFDTIISSDCFQHDAEYKQSILKIYEMLKPNGLFFFTCASTGRNEHGTIATSPGDSYATLANIENFRDYYYNLTINDINNVINLNKSFSYWQSYYNSFTKDLYFIGIKNNDFIDYQYINVIKTTNDI